MEKRTLQKVGLLCASVALCSAASWWSGNEGGSREARQIAEPPATTAVEEVPVTVCVSGAVKQPGVYQIPKGSRAQQVIELAGGVTEEADMDKVNLAQLCKDGGHIKVPRLSQARLKKKLQKKAETVQRTEDPAASGTGGILVHLNSATEEELEQLPGIGQATARQIVLFRNRRGFRSIEEIMQVPGIGPAKFAKMRDCLTL
ncbi:MAG: ComEA family DNA-binding protein [Succiniclasticum sp.]|uniref:ComEA family DNA-binding protein n=1 Tax=Succiniclasticum sp. TaxID=2775030 RepID=UPI002A9194C7|nr:ComEA family DNA-binding protein [Succiniclasticum sp.]MDY6292132.1 ComEA family DNA-binding protein [Succiniclasticum sp.]